jgi:hypothetical protein
MARWSESRGYTLVLTHPRAPDRYARLTMVRKRTLFGQAFNVMEARAEDPSRSGHEPETLGAGRMLSWRWLGEREADQLLSARLRTLEALGYRILGESGQATRGTWDWLKELVDRQIERAQHERPAAREEPEPEPEREVEAEPGSDAEPQAPELEPQPEPHPPRSPEGLRELLAHLGLAPEAIVEGIAEITGIEEAQLRAPDLDTLRRVEPEMSTMLLQYWLEHDSAQLREIGRRWLALEPVPYEIEVEILEAWAASEGPLAAALGERLEREGLALLGPEGLARLAHKAIEPRNRAIAARWQQRLRPELRAPG